MRFELGEQIRIDNDVQVGDFPSALLFGEFLFRGHVAILFATAAKFNGNAARQYVLNASNASNALLRKHPLAKTPMRQSRWQPRGR